MSRIAPCGAALFGAALLLAAPPALSQTVNDYTPAQQARAEAAVRAAGYAPINVSWSQAGYLFVRAQKDGKLYYLTVSPTGETWASTPVDLPRSAGDS